MNIGGPAIQAGLLTARLDPARFETLLVAGSEGPSEGNILHLGRLPSSVRPILIPELGRRVAPLDDLRALWKVIRIARAYRPDIVHTHLAKAGFVGRVAAMLSGARAVVHTYHGSVFRGYFGRHESAIYLGIERALARITTRIVAITPGQRAELTNLLAVPPGKVVEIPLGLDLDSFQNAPDRLTARERLGLPAHDPVVGIAGRLVPIKDVSTFLRAVASLTKDFPNLTALIAGDGEERVALEREAAALEIEGRCRFLGWRADLPTIFASVDVVALSSLNEGTPVSVIEAMAAGRPVVASAVGGVPYVVLHKRTGLLVRPRDPEALASAIRSVLRDPDLATSFGNEGRREALRRFAAARLVDDIERLYSDLIPSRRSPPS